MDKDSKKDHSLNNYLFFLFRKDDFFYMLSLKNTDHRVLNLLEALA